MKRVIALLVLLSMLLSGCAALSGDALGTGATVNGMKSAINGAPGSFIYAKEGVDYFLLGWSQNGKYAFMFVDSAGKILQDWSQIVGAKVRWTDAYAFTKWLEADGWKTVPCTSLPTVIVQGIKQMAFLVSVGKAATPNFLIVPASIVDHPLETVFPQVQQ